MSLAQKLVLRARALWELAKNEHATPREIGWAVGVGVFAGCTPALGFHGALAVGMATVLRLNRMWTWIGSRVSNIFVLPFIVLAEVQVAHRVRTGAWALLETRTILQERHALLGDWLLGTIPVGGALGLLLGALAFFIARRRRPRPRSNPRADVAPSADRRSRP